MDTPTRITRPPDWLRRPITWLMLIILVWVVLSSSSLMTYPGPYIDEAWWGSIADNYIKTGQYGASVFPSYDVLSYSHVKLGYPYVAGLALVFRVFGTGFLQARIFSLAGTLLGGVLLFLLGRRLYDSAVGITAMALYMFSPRVLVASHMVRPETWAISIGLLALLFFFVCKRNLPPLAHFWSWDICCVDFKCLSHPDGSYGINKFIHII